MGLSTTLSRRTVLTFGAAISAAHHVNGNVVRSIANIVPRCQVELPRHEQPPLYPNLNSHVSSLGHGTYVGTDSDGAGDWDESCLT